MSKEYIFRNSFFCCFADFSSVEFSNNVDFSYATFQNNTLFKNTKFRKNIKFDSAVFKESDFNSIEFQNDNFETSFKSVQFQETIDFKTSIFKGKTIFDNTKFMQDAFFESAKFYNDVSYKKVTFYDEVNFTNTKFIQKSVFKRTKFNKYVSFKKVKFQKNADFTDCEFQEKANFTNTKFKYNAIFKNIQVKRIIIFDYALLHKANFSFAQGRNISFKNARLYKIILDNIDFENKNFLELKKYSSDITRTDAIATRESARIIKDTFESQHNIIESNKYYRIEMDLWREEIAKNFKGNKIKSFISNRDFFNLTLFKYVSEYATNWVQVLFWIVFLGFVSLLFICVNNGYMRYRYEIDYIVPLILIIISMFSSYKNEAYKIVWLYGFIGFAYTLFYIKYFGFSIIISIFNRLGQLIYPSSAPNSTFLLLLIKLLFAYLAYQFIISMRQNTRRK